MADDDYEVSRKELAAQREARRAVPTGKRGGRVAVAARDHYDDDEEEKEEEEEDEEGDGHGESVAIVRNMVLTSPQGGLLLTDRTDAGVLDKVNEGGARRTSAAVAKKAKIRKKRRKTVDPAKKKGSPAWVFFRAAHESESQKFIYCKAFELKDYGRIFTRVCSGKVKISLDDNGVIEPQGIQCDGSLQEVPPKMVEGGESGRHSGKGCRTCLQ